MPPISLKVTRQGRFEVDYSSKQTWKFGDVIDPQYLNLFTKFREPLITYSQLESAKSCSFYGAPQGDDTVAFQAQQQSSQLRSQSNELYDTLSTALKRAFLRVEKEINSEQPNSPDFTTRLKLAKQVTKEESLLLDAFDEIDDKTRS